MDSLVGAPLVQEIGGCRDAAAVRRAVAADQVRDITAARVDAGVPVGARLQEMRCSPTSELSMSVFAEFRNPPSVTDAEPADAGVEDFGGSAFAFRRVVEAVGEFSGGVGEAADSTQE